MLNNATSETRNAIIPHCAGLSVDRQSRSPAVASRTRCRRSGRDGSVELHRNVEIAHAQTLCLLVLPIGIVRMLQVPQRSAAVHSGIVSKLYDGGGEVVAHSSVQASQGSSPAGLPFRSEIKC